MRPKPPITDDVLHAPADEHAWSNDEVSQYLAAPGWTDEVADTAEPDDLGEAEDQS